MFEQLKMGWLEQVRMWFWDLRRFENVKKDCTRKKHDKMFMSTLENSSCVLQALYAFTPNIDYLDKLV